MFYLYVVVGWVDIGTRTKVPLKFVIPYLSKVTKINEKKCFDPVTASSLVKTFWVMHYKEVKKILFHNMDFMGIKRCRIFVDFKNIKQYSDKMHLKKDIPR
jgi:hypothetical protein